MRSRLDTTLRNLESSDINNKLLVIIKIFDAEVVTISLPFTNGSKGL